MVLDMFLLVLPATLQHCSGNTEERSGAGSVPIPALGGLCGGWERAGMVWLYHPLLHVTCPDEA